MKSVGPAEVRNWKLEFGHKKRNDLIGALVNDQVRISVTVSLLKVDDHNLATPPLGFERHGASGRDSHARAHANDKIRLSAESSASLEDSLIQVLTKVNACVLKDASTARLITDATCFVIVYLFGISSAIVTHVFLGASYAQFEVCITV